MKIINITNNKLSDDEKIIIAFKKKNIMYIVTKKRPTARTVDQNELYK